MTDDEKESVYKKVSTFEDLEVFQRAYRLSLAIHKASLEFPKIEQFSLADQIRKASKSICANIAEGYMRVWIRYCLDLGYISQNIWESWREDYSRIARMLQSLIHKIT